MIKVLTIDNVAEWDCLVRSFANYDSYWLNGYVRAFQVHGDGEPQLLYYENKDLLIRGINVVMKRDISADSHFQGKLKPNTYFDYATPYGYGGWLIDNPQGESIRSLFKEYLDFCQHCNIVSEFVRFHPLVKNHENLSPYYETVQLGEVVAIDLSSPEKIWTNFTSQNRNKIRKALKNGVQIYHGRYPQIYDVFRKIYNQTMDKDHATKYYYFEPTFYESILNDLSENAQVFYAQIPDGTIIAASIMLTANGRMNYHLSGSLREYNALAPVNLLLYKAALWGSSNGCHTLYLGGGVGSEEDSLLTFKKSFNKGNLTHFFIGRKIFDQDKYNNLCSQRGIVTDLNGFFPAYRIRN